MPSQTGNAGKFLSTDGTDASWQYSITDKGMYSAITQYYPGDVVLYYYDNTYRSYLCIQSALNETPYNEASSYWKPFDTPSKIRIQNDWGDKPILPFMMNGSSGSTITGVMLTPGTTSTVANFPTINTSTGLLKAPSGIDGYSPDSAFGATAFSNDYSDLDNLPNYGAGLSYSSSSLQLLDQNGNNLGSAVTIKSTPDLDGVTIDTNSDDELEAIGTVNKNTAVGATAVKYDWIGTLAEYNAQNVETLHPEWICYITDDVSGGASVYTKTEVNNLLNEKADTDLNNITPTQSFISMVIGWLMPDYNNAVTLTSSDFPYTATKSGIVYINGAASNSTFEMFVNGVKLGSAQAPSSYHGRSGQVIVDVGDIVTYVSTGLVEARFVPFKGA